MPRQFYAQLLQFTNRPVIECHQSSNTLPKAEPAPPLLAKLHTILFPSTESTYNAKEPKVRRSDKMSRFFQSSEKINLELGGWAATRYMQASITQFKDGMRANAEKTDIVNSGKQHAMEALCSLGVLEQYTSEMQPEDISPMCQCLVSALVQEYSNEFCGLVFVSQRATALALKWLIEDHPDTKNLFRCGTFVGMSTFQHSSTNLGDLHDIKSQTETLERFRQRSINLIIATDALEEGIDVPACNTVLNFNCPLNLKSFIQRRGRARAEKAKFIVIVNHDADVQYLSSIEKAENELIKQYQDEERLVREFENDDTASHIRELMSLSIASTGALLAMGDAVRYLYVFVAKLSTQAYGNSKPLFHCEPNASGEFQATVRLPSCLDPSLHKFTSSSSWPNKKSAREDAAVRAYKALYRAGLVNDHLAPTMPSDILGQDFQMQSHYIIADQLNHWLDLARIWDLDGQVYSHELRIIRPQMHEIKLFLILPTSITTEIRIPLYISSCTTYTAVLSPGQAANVQIPVCQEATNLILQSINRGTWTCDDIDYVFLLIPDIESNVVAEFVQEYRGTTSLIEALRNRIPPMSLGLLRCLERLCRPLVVESWTLPEDDTLDTSEMLLSALGKMQPLTRCRNFLHARQNASMDKASTRERVLQMNLKADKNTLLVKEYSVDRLPSTFTQAAVLIPSITHEVGVYLVAERLASLLFGDSAATFRRIDLLAIAIRPTSIEHRSDFRFLAFLGDAMIKCLVARQLFLHHVLWHEGLLSQVSQTILSDAGLAQAISQSDLPKFSQRGTSNSPRLVGAATLADMVKALAGAAFLDNGIDNAAACLAKLVPRIKSWSTSSLHDGTYAETRPKNVASAAATMDLEKLLDYIFMDKSLAKEAMTHPSCTGLSGTTSFRRLAFLGMSVLEWVVVDYLHRQNASLSPRRLQSLKSAVTNKMFLTFVCLSFHRKLGKTTIVANDERNISTCREEYPVHLWNFIKWNEDGMSAVFSQITQKLAEVDIIRHELWEQGVYPWARLSALGNIKALSDIVKSIFGAVYVDSLAKFRNCEILAERFGILPILQHLILYNIDTDHPKETSHHIPPPTQLGAAPQTSSVSQLG
ncbi:Dicer-like protein 2 [Aspergillus wentii]|nr:Dicer-like protein 2 [Aspergillus wentii]